MSAIVPYLYEYLYKNRFNTRNMRCMDNSFYAKSLILGFRLVIYETVF